MRSPRGPAVLLALAGGLVVATQARVNGEFGQSVGSPAAAAMLSAATGLAIVTPIVWLTPRIRAGLLGLPGALRQGTLPRWTLLAGTVGGFLLFSQAYAVPALGVALYSVLIVASLTSASLLVDRAGLGPAGPQSITPNRIGGATLAVVAALLAAGPDLNTGTLALLACLVAITAGSSSAAQSAMLGRLGVSAGQPLAAVWVNFVGAVLTLALIVAGSTAGGASWQVPALSWAWLGGPLGLLVVVTIVVTVPRAGVLLVTMALTAGQLLGSLLWDLAAPVSGRGVDGWSVAGAGLLMAAVVLAARPART
ncbi:MAG: DMT family transporter [Candidatus Nanopelagicales bacterium]